MDALCPKPFTAPPTTTTLPTTTTPTPCALSQGYVELDLQIDSFSNMFDLDANGVKCDFNGINDDCDIVFSICVSSADAVG